jgi:monoamine oxidase
MYYAQSGHFVEEQENMEDWNTLIRKMKAVKADLPFMQFLLENFTSERYRKLRESAVRFAEGFDLADVHTVSTISLIREWEEEESSEQYRIPDGYGQLTEALSKEFISSGGKIFLSQPVNRIEWARGEVNITTTGKRKFHSKKLLITLPIGVLTHMQEGDYTIHFSPEIPAKRAALQQIGFGTVIKIVLQWQTPFWNSFVPDAQFIFSAKDIPAWWTQNPTDSNILTGWVGGPAAGDLSGLSENELLGIALGNLSDIFGIPVKELKTRLLEAKIFNWGKEIFTRGAYSFSLVASERAKTIWKSPLEKTLYFAGEACYEGPHGGTVEAAIISGIETAREIVKQWGAG